MRPLAEDSKVTHASSGSGPVRVSVSVEKVEEALKAIEAELGRSLDGTRATNISHIRSGRFEETLHDDLREEVIQRLQWMGVDTDLLVWSAVGNRDYIPRQKEHVAAE